MLIQRTLPLGLLSIALLLQLYRPLATQWRSRISQSSTTPSPASTTRTTPANPTSPVNPSSPVPSPINSPNPLQQVISACKGIPDNAHFREFPTRNPAAILGVIKRGESVELTRRTQWGDGVLWYEAIAPNALEPSLEPAAQNQLQAGQRGWVAGCFITNTMESGG